MHLLRGLRLGRPFGVRIVAHVSWLPAAGLLVLLLALYVFTDRPLVTAFGLGAATAVGLLLCVLVHEAGHAWMSRSIGVPMRDSTLFVFGGVARVNREPSKPAQEVAIALAGPVTSAALAAFLLGVASPGLVGDALRALAALNLSVAALNLLPGFPLDGGRLVRAWVWARSGDPYRGSIRAAMAGQALSVALILAGVALAWTRDVGEVLWLPVLGGFLYVLASSARRAAGVASKLGRQPAREWARPLAGALTGEESAAYVRSAGGGPFAVCTAGRLDGVVLLDSLGAGVDPFTRIRQLMVHWSPRITCSDRLPMSRALERLSVAADGILVVVDDSGAVVGVLDHGGVRERMET